MPGVAVAKPPAPATTRSGFRCGCREHRQQSGPPAASAGCYHRAGGFHPAVARMPRRLRRRANARRPGIHSRAPQNSPPRRTRRRHVQATDIRRPDYFHRVVDCQWACPAHTPVPEYIRLIASGRYTDAYMVNWQSNVFPGILGRTCDRPCEPACRRGRVEENQVTRPEPVAICRLKRVAADLKGDIQRRLPKRAARRNGKRIACVGAGPASLTVARDLAPLGYEVIVFDQDPKAGGMIRTQIPALPTAGRSHRRGNRLRARARRRVPRRRAHRFDEGAAQGRVRRDLRRLRRAAGARSRRTGPSRSRRAYPHRHRLAFIRLFRARHESGQTRHRPRRRQHGDGLLPDCAPARAARTSRSSCAPASMK